jgi:hypothetical protein
MREELCSNMEENGCPFIYTIIVLIVFMREATWPKHLNKEKGDRENNKVMAKTSKGFLSLRI